MQIKISQLNTQPKIWLTSTGRVVKATDDQPEIARCFEPFAKTVQVRWDKQFLFVESNGMPDHPMVI